MKAIKKIKTMKYLFMILIYSMILLSCEDNEIEESPSEQALAQLEGGVPEEKSIDINNDGQYDFEIRYPILLTGDFPPSTLSISGQINPLNDNQLLRQDDNRSYLFLEEGDTIKKNNNSNSTWSDYSASLIGIQGKSIRDEEGDFIKTNEGYYKYEWDDNWNVRADITSDFFLGFKLKTSDPKKIGWMLLDLNKENGEISIIESKITDSNKLVIEK